MVFFLGRDLDQEQAKIGTELLHGYSSGKRGKYRRRFMTGADGTVEEERGNPIGEQRRGNLQGGSVKGANSKGNPRPTANEPYLVSEQVILTGRKTRQ